jgi:amidophosphoribosyltransferase
MSDKIKHECGIALVRLLKPLDYYQKKYGTSLYGINKMHLLLEKQHNRGQDGAGLASIKLDTPAGERYISRYRSNAPQPLKEIFGKVYAKFEDVRKTQPEKLEDAEWLKSNVSFTGELLLGHLRYGTFGKNSIESCHPFLRQNNWKTRNLVVAGNFNLTNVEELFQQLVELGQHPKEKADTVTVMERIGHFLDVENDRLYKEYKTLGFSNAEISNRIAEKLDIEKILKDASRRWDGGYVMAGLIGHGDAFVLRDPNGIRPCYYYFDDEIAVVTSERPTMQTAFNLDLEQISELQPGNALIIKKNGTITEVNINESTKKTSCSFERIYFSRGSDIKIYQERKELGRTLVPSILNAVNNDLKNTVFSYIPNTAETAFYGMMSGVEDYLTKVKHKKILAMGNAIDPTKLTEILSIKPRAEKLAIKDAKLRTFITSDNERDEMVSHVYDVTYGAINKGVDNIVVIDDSIVRGTTLKQSIIKMLDRLSPKKIIIVSSAPQIRYPDCYGIDMAKMGDFIAFQAAIELLKESGKEKLIEQVYHKAKAELLKPKSEVKNAAKEIYESFSYEQISNKIASMLRTPQIKAEVQIVYQSIEGLHAAIPNHKGDWYFSGNYPTQGGMCVANQAFINYYEGKNARAY